MIAERTRSVAEQFDRLESEARQTTTGIQELKGRLASIDQESKKRIEVALSEGGLMRQQALTEANAQAAQELTKTQRTIQIERDKALLELRLEVVRLTLAVTEQAVENVVDERLHGRMVEKYLSDVDRVAQGV
jgi:F-type H+-transporting ATPase subunit b